MKPSEEIELGDTGLKLKDGILVDKNNEPVNTVRNECPGCGKTYDKCNCTVAFEEEA